MKGSSSVHGGLDFIKRIGLGGEKKKEVFPSKLYCVIYLKQCNSQTVFL